MSEPDPVEAKLMALPEPDLDDPDNPEWTEEMFARAKQDEHLLPAEVRALLKRPVGRPKSERPKVAAYIRLDADVIEHFKAGGPGWQTRINAELRRAIKS